ncbi:unnamed protein product [Nippostrongylus brasiliensis]|uniref:DDE_3 domain-containing protein n=1 Tax=Nippostrongylus brasiliensis TaxID=27835 RepID=A0A0N4YIX1_NIPBR|nr:unnamed protein product [Nippostrongylus brasiliensis]
MMAITRGDKLDRILFTDEKIFTVEPLQNAQDQRELLPKGSHRAVNIGRTHFPQSLMVWAGISGLGKTKIVFIQKKNVKSNAEVYRKQILEAEALRWAPAQSAKKNLEWCEANFPSCWTKEILPSNSPDLNPMDFATWSILKQKACSSRHGSLISLKKALEKVWNEISQEMIARILQNFRKRLNACIKAKGGHFECDV